jgi:anion-transporting  ArsA/GET3 family ATPase
MYLADDELLQYYNLRIQDIGSLEYKEYQAMMKEMIDYLNSNKEKLVEKYDVEYFDEIRRKFELESIYGGKADDFNYNTSIFNTREKFIFENVKDVIESNEYDVIFIRIGMFHVFEGEMFYML